MGIHISTWKKLKVGETDAWNMMPSSKEPKEEDVSSFWKISKLL